MMYRKTLTRLIQLRHLLPNRYIGIAMGQTKMWTPPVMQKTCLGPWEEIQDAINCDTESAVGVLK